MIQLHQPIDRPNPFNELTEQRIRFRSSRLAKAFGLSEHDRDDLAQDLRLLVLRKLDKHDPERGSLNAFAHGVMDNWYRETARRLRTQRKANRETLSSDALRSIVPPMLDEVENTDRKLDLHACLSSIPASLRRVASLRAEHKPGEIARRFGVHRGTVHRWLDEVRTHICESFPQFAAEFSTSGATVYASAAEG